MGIGPMLAAARDKRAEQNQRQNETNYLRYGALRSGYEPGMVQADFGNKGASTTYGRIARADWEDYKRRFIPYEKKLMGIYGNMGMLNDQIDRNVQASNYAFDSADRSADDMRRLYGANMTTRQTDAYNRKRAMQKNMSRVNATNMTRLAKKDRDMQLMAGANASAGNLRKAYKNE